MRLKILIVPFFAVMTLIIGIGYIQPDFVSMQMKQAEIADKEGQVSKLETTLSNISSMNASLNAKEESERFVMNSLPDSLDQEKTVDMLNFLANQSGLIMTDLVMKEISDVSRLSALPDFGAATPLVSGAGAVVDPAAQGMVLETPTTAKAYTVRAQVRGSYENIKTFLDRAAHSGRSYRIRLLGVSADTQTADPAGSGVPAPAPELIGTFDAYFDYLPKAPIRSALDMPVFQKNELDFSIAAKALEQVKGAVPPLEKSVAGKPNPFQ